MISLSTSFRLPGDARCVVFSKSVPWTSNVHGDLCCWIVAPAEQHDFSTAGAAGGRQLPSSLPRGVDSVAAYGTDPQVAMMLVSTAALVPVAAPGQVIRYALRRAALAGGLKYGL